MVVLCHSSYTKMLTWDVKTMGNLSAVKTVLNFYDELWLIRDKRVDHWPMMNSPWPTIGLCSAYIYICCVLGPALMKHRPAFELHKPIMVYNVLQVVFSGYVFYEASVAGWLTGNSYLVYQSMTSIPPRVFLRIQLVVPRY